MNILVITRDYPPHTNGGISTAVWYEVQGLVAAGHRCTVVSFDAFRPVTQALLTDQVPRIDFSCSPAMITLSAPSAIPAALEAARQARPDVIHLHHSTLLDFALDLSGGHVPIVKTVHVIQHQMNWYRGLESTITSKAQARAVATCWRAVVMSRAAAQMMAAEFPEFSDKFRVIAPGVPDQPGAADASWPRPDRIAVHAGRFSDIKGTEVLFDVARGLTAADPRNHVVIAGGLPDGQPSERRYMRKWARGATGPDDERVSFPGWLDRSQLSALFLQSSVYLATSVFETFGLSIAEAMLHGVPVVATACGGPQEIIEPGVSGMVVPVGDTRAIVAAASSILDSPDRCAEMGRAARQSILKRFDVRTHTESLEAVYREVIS